MGKYCCNKNRLISFLKENTDRDNSLSRSQIEAKMGNEFSLDRKTFTSYVADSKSIIDENPNFGYIETLSAGPSTTYYYEPAKNELDEDEIRIIIDSVLSLKSISPEMKKTIKDKLLSQTNKFVRKGYDEISKVLNKSIGKTRDNNYYVEQECLKIIVEAIRNGRSILFDYYWYTPQKIKITRYTDHNAFPQTLFISEGYYYLIAYNPMKRVKRYYRVDRMQNVRIGGKFNDIDIPNDCKFDYEEFIYSNFNMFRGEVKEITFKCNLDLANQMYDKFGDYEIVSQNDKEFIFKAKVEVGRTFYGWLCGYAGEIKILEPQDEVEAFNQHIDKLKTE